MSLIHVIFARFVLSTILLLHLGTCWPQGVGWGRVVWKTVLSFWNTPIFVRSLVSYTWTWREFGWLEILCVHFSALAFLLSHCLMTAVQGDCIDFTGFGTVTTGRNVVPVPMRVTKHRTPLERELEAVEGISLHQFNQPVAEVLGRVSIVTSTTASRARFHPQLWQCFLDQTWADKELVVVETYHHEPSSFFQSIARVDSRLRSVAIKRPVGEDLTVGAKRNLTILLASGQYCVNFDDDDLYADRYVECMVTAMQRRNLVALTLSGWHNYFEARGSAGYSEPKSWDPEDQDEMDEILYGYGFSYVHLRVMALFYPYPNLAFAEDAPFMLKLRQKMGRVGLMEDVDGLLLAHRPLEQQHTWPWDLPSLNWRGARWPGRFGLQGLWRFHAEICRTIPQVSHGSLVSLPVCLNFGHAAESCRSDPRTCRSDQWFHIISHEFHQFQISPWVLQFHHVHKCSRKVGKETTAFEPGRKIPCISEGELSCLNALHTCCECKGIQTPSKPYVTYSLVFEVAWCGKHTPMARLFAKIVQE